MNLPSHISYEIVHLQENIPSKFTHRIRASAYSGMEHNNYTSRLAHFREKAKAFTFVVFGGSMILDSFNVEGLAFDQISIATHFGINIEVASWSLSAYSLTYGSFLLLSGSAGTYPVLICFQTLYRSLC
jgi:hypothetical protein